MSTGDKLLNAAREIERLQEENNNLRISRDLWKKTAEAKDAVIERMKKANGLDMDGNPIIYGIH